MTSGLSVQDRHTDTGPKPVISGRRDTTSQLLIYVFSAVPLLAVAAAVPFAWGWGLSWTDIGIAAAFYLVAGLGVTVGFHRHFTHGSFHAKRGAADRVGDRRATVAAGAGDRLGRRSPQAPRVLRPGR